jgi:hypothetical protein
MRELSLQESDMVMGGHVTVLGNIFGVIGATLGGAVAGSFGGAAGAVAGGSLGNSMENFYIDFGASMVPEFDLSLSSGPGSVGDFTGNNGLEPGSGY